MHTDLHTVPAVPADPGVPGAAHPDLSVATAAPSAVACRVRPVAARTAVVLVAALTVLGGLGGRHPRGATWAVAALVAGGAALWAAHRRGPCAGLWSLLGVGVAGVVMGVSMGLPHAARTGVTATSVAGVVALLSGLAVVVLTGTALVRRLRRWWRLLALPAVATGAAFVVMPLAMALFVSQVPPLELGDDRPADHGLLAEDVTVRTADGLDLDAWYVPSTNGAAVVLLPGAGSTCDEELDHAEVLARHGYGVLLLDVRGHGGSDGHAMLWGWDGDADVAAAMTFLLARPDVVDGRVGVVGMSMGGEQALGAAATDPRIRAVVAEGATGRGPYIEGRDPQGVAGLFEDVLGGVVLQATDLLSAGHQPPRLVDAVAAAAPRPIFVIAADLDEEITAGRAFVAAAPASVELWIVPDTGHTAGLDTHPAEWESRVVDFLDRTLG